MIRDICIIFEKILKNIIDLTIVDLIYILKNILKNITKNIVDTSNFDTITNKDINIDENTIINENTSIGENIIIDKKINISWFSTIEDVVASLKTSNFDFFV